MALINYVIWWGFLAFVSHIVLFCWISYLKGRLARFEWKEAREEAAQRAIDDIPYGR